MDAQFLFQVGAVVASLSGAWALVRAQVTALKATQQEIKDYVDELNREQDVVENNVAVLRSQISVLSNILSPDNLAKEHKRKGIVHAQIIKLQEEVKTLDSHCRKTKRIRRKLWTPKGGYFKTITDCTTDYDDQGEKYINLKKLKLGTHHDYSNDRGYLELNGYYFFVGNKRRIAEFKNKIISYAKQYCGLK